MIFNEKWWIHINKTLENFMCSLRNKVHVSQNKELDLFCKCYIENLKYDLTIANILSYMLFCERYISRDVDCKKYCQNYVSSKIISNSFKYILY